MSTQVSPARLGELLGGAWKAFSRRGQAAFQEHGLSGAQVRLLLALSETPDARMIDLAGRLGVSGRAITPLVDALEAEDLVSRRQDPTDRRAFRLELTAHGRAQVRRVGQLQQSISAEIFAVLTEAQQRQLAHLLSTFIEKTT